MKKIAFAAAVLLLSGIHGATAADLPGNSAPYAPAGNTYTAQPYNWNGFYAGINAGYGWGSHRRGAANLFRGPRGGVVGGQMGFNYQSDSLVLGVEGDIYWSSMSANRVFPGPIITKASTDWAGSLRARAGFAADRALIYLTSGLAFGRINVNVSDSVTPIFVQSTYSRAGWVIGAGIEYAFTDKISIKTEFIYTRYASKAILAAPYATSSGLSTSLIRAGVNYHF